MELLNVLSNALDNYFKALEQFGYKKESDVNKLLAIICIEELVNGDMRKFINESDYKAIEKAVYCLLGTSCLLPYPSFVEEDNIWGVVDDSGGLRLTESADFRLMESNNMRISEFDNLG